MDLLIYLIIVASVCSCTPREIENAEIADVRYCRNCITIKDAFEFERKIGSKRLKLSVPEISSYSGKVVEPISSTNNEKFNLDYRIIFKRKSSLSAFTEFITYSYKFYTDPDSTLYDTGVIDFNLGKSAIGFAADTGTTPGKEFMLKPVNPISLMNFKAGYYSILKWLYSLETDKRKVVKERIQYFDHDYYSSPEVELDEMVFEDPWQEDFLFYKYQLVGEDKYSYFVSVEPGTYAPITLYEVQEDYHVPEHGLYHINISDMSIRIKFSADFTGLGYRQFKE